MITRVMDEDAGDYYCVATAENNPGIVEIVESATANLTVYCKYRVKFWYFSLYILLHIMISSGVFIQ